MTMAPLPVNEAQRLETLQLHRILDTEAKESFSRFAPGARAAEE